MNPAFFLALLQALLVYAKPLPQASDNGSEFFAPIPGFVPSTSSVVPSVQVTTVPTSSGTVQILPEPSTQLPATQGIIVTQLDPAGIHTGNPLLRTSIPSPTTTLGGGQPTAVPGPKPLGALADNIFQPVSTDPPPGNIPQRADHPVPRLNVLPSQQEPIGTNKFWQNFLLGSQTSGTWTHPYSIAWSKGKGATGSWGMSISHIEDNQKVFGEGNPARYFANPIGVQSIVISALELGGDTILSSERLTAFSAHISLHARAGDRPLIQLPIVQGMGFVTAGCNVVTPILQSGVLFRSIKKASQNPKPGVMKFIIELEDNNKWFLYAWSPSGNNLDFTVVNNELIQATSTFDGVLQFAKDPGNGEALYDAASGAWPVTVDLSGTADGAIGAYTFTFRKEGYTSNPPTLLMYALPHHIASFSQGTRANVKDLQLDTTTKGRATAVVADSWTLSESLPTSMGFGPWDPDQGEKKGLSGDAKRIVHAIAEKEISQDMNAQSNLNSMYYSGKALAKFAQIVYVLNDMLDDKGLAQSGLSKLKQAFAVFIENRQQFPLFYESAWHGLVSSSTYATADAGTDFGNTYYNDHHFHYGYFVYAAAIIGHVDPSWIDPNKAYINALVRDYANPSPLDTFFPQHRNFDWYHGHSFAHGLYETADGRDEESSSEDIMSLLALKLWGSVIGDRNLEARGNLQLAIASRALQNYFLYDSTNANQPSNFIGNKVSGILFENKIDHVTYFGTNIEYIQGIHMIPLIPASGLARTKRFVTEEWNAFFNNGRAEGTAGGWRGILMANLALINPKASWDWFVNGAFDAAGLDGGASQTWYAAMAGALAGV
ncbi:hypothetical protein HYFRA_00012062 [Hymenoscyphus fraxineus]|uniref:glucan endo-1,3-beta-D-glucosidase n=1 Tax=Hymenoscyphus fraxineus TaxID=746836 RepID=A0A9N9L1V2_9HELO|nr:hypothetical protein HYFRA_00012062 [Hymenoscyphus fraxineus]